MIQIILLEEPKKKKKKEHTFGISMFTRPCIPDILKALIWITLFT